MRRTAGALAVASVLGAAGAAHGQVQPVPPADAPTPGSGAVEGDVVVTRQEQVRVRVRCIQGELACSGTVRLRTQRPVAPGKGKNRRILAVAGGSFGPLQPGEMKTVPLTLQRDIRSRVRSYRSTDIAWDTYAPDGSKNFLFIPHTTTLISRVAR